MEKMRRARINDSLNELKTLILEALNKDVSNQHSKLLILTLKKLVNWWFLEIIWEYLLTINSTLFFRLLAIRKWRKLMFWKWQYITYGNAKEWSKNTKVRLFIFFIVFDLYGEYKSFISSLLSIVFPQLSKRWFIIKCLFAKYLASHVFNQKFNSSDLDS